MMLFIFAFVLLSNIINMKNIGFVIAAQNIEQTECVVELMKKYGCVSIHVEELRSNNRLRWKEFVDELEDSDVAILYSFDNAFKNIHDMIFFLKFCSKRNIRIVSIEDRVDSNDTLPSGQTIKDIFDVVCKMFSKRDRNSHDDIEADLYSNRHSDRRLKRYRMVINMYNAGYSVKEIMERTGYRGKSNIYRILHLYDVSLEYPAMSRSKSSNDVPI